MREKKTKRVQEDMNMSIACWKNEDEQKSQIWDDLNIGDWGQRLLTVGMLGGESEKWGDSQRHTSRYCLQTRHMLAGTAWKTGKMLADNAWKTDKMLAGNA